MIGEPHLIDLIKKQIGYTSVLSRSCRTCAHSREQGDGVYEGEKDLLCSLVTKPLGVYLPIEANGKCEKWEKRP